MLKGTDGEIRGAEIIVADKNGKLSRMQHDLQFLYHLEAKQLSSKEPKELNVRQNMAEPIMHRKSKTRLHCQGTYSESCDNAPGLVWEQNVRKSGEM